MMVVKRCSDTYRSRPCRQVTARVLSTPRGPLLVARAGGYRPQPGAGVQPTEVKEHMLLDLLEWPPDRSGDDRPLFAVCRRHGGHALDRDQVLAAAVTSKRIGKVVEI